MTGACTCTWTRIQRRLHASNSQVGLRVNRSDNAVDTCDKATNPDEFEGEHNVLAHFIVNHYKDNFFVWLTFLANVKLALAGRCQSTADRLAAGDQRAPTEDLCTGLLSLRSKMQIFYSPSDDDIPLALCYATQQ